MNWKTLNKLHINIWKTLITDFIAMEYASPLHNYASETDLCRPTLSDLLQL